jgi:Domain of unknown function (DUF4166)
MTAPLYRRLLGAQFDVLPRCVRELHDLEGVSVWQGRADVERGRSWPSRVAAMVSGLPPAGPDQLLRVTFAEAAGREVWSRRFGAATFRSVQYARGDYLCERIGIVTFEFAVVASAEGLALDLKGLRVLGIPVPRFLHPVVATFESERDGRYHFRVNSRLPLFGLLVAYSGWLERDDVNSDF